MANLWLITGVPGSGKTTLGNYLREKHNFVHLDFEANDYNDFVNTPAEFVTKVKSSNKNTVITWGFGPDALGLSHVGFLRQNGFVMFWFDGSRVASFKAFLNRSTASEEAYHYQMWRIESSKVTDILTPVFINPFKIDDSFRDKENIVAELKSK